MGGDYAGRWDAQSAGQGLGELPCILQADVLTGTSPAEPLGIPPQRPAVGAEKTAQPPARQGIAGVSLALTQLRHPAGRQPQPQTLQQLLGGLKLGGTQCRGIPLRRRGFVD
jgi:hypothetical protein